MSDESDKSTSKDEEFDRIREKLAAQEAQIKQLLGQSGSRKTYFPDQCSTTLSDEDDEDHHDQNKESDMFVEQFNNESDTSADINEENDLNELLKDVEGTIEYGPEVKSQIAEGFVKTAMRPLSKDSSLNMKEKLKIPSNCKQFQVPKINAEIWNHLPTPSKMADIKYQQIQQSLTQGLVGLTRIAHEVVSNDVPNATRTSILKIAIDTANLLGDQLQNISARRKSDVKRFINPEYSAICSTQVSGTEFLFGNDLNEALKASKAVSNVNTTTIFKLPSPILSAVSSPRESRGISRGKIPTTLKSAVSTISPISEVEPEPSKNKAGYNLEFTTLPKQDSEPVFPKMSEIETNYIDSSIKDLLVKGAIKISAEEEDSKVKKVIEKAGHIVNRQLVSIQDVAELVGLFISACPAVQYGQLYTRQLEFEKTVALRQFGHYNGNIELSNEAKNDISWWIKNVPAASRPIGNMNYKLVITTDGLLTGWGAACNGKSAKGAWSFLEKRKHVLDWERRSTLAMGSTTTVMSSFQEDSNNYDFASGDLRSPSQNLQLFFRSKW
ncbi:hypothetical protein Fcan01_23311 [Folsomia candida]|uniref:Uncharacterized protein n=1 Tax=Folsomia candida TaxID=158441 RepID=A0A226DBV6_FOLCA|nr:hypothetical protein Fcan01_23311 [Folsomia candida]